MQNQSGVEIPLSGKKRNIVTAGSALIMLGIFMNSTGFAVILRKLLTTMDALPYFTLITLLRSTASTIMTPISGKLIDLFGLKKVTIVGGIMCVITSLGLSQANSVMVICIMAFLNNLSYGTMVPIPYTIVRKIHERKDVSRANGYISSAVAIGSFAGGIIAGKFADMNLLQFAILFPLIPELLAVLLVAGNIPRHERKQQKTYIDIPGILLMSTGISALLISLNYGGRIGWGNPYVLAGLAGAVVLIILFISVELKSPGPIIPISLFSRKQYTVSLIVGGLCYYYFNAMNSYGPYVVQSVLGVSATVSGSLLLPRTIITMALPAFVGTWVGKQKCNLWKAMAISTTLVTLSFIPLAFTSPSTPLMVFLVAFAITGIAESFRSVSITPSAQDALDASNMGVGTSIVNFVNTLSMAIAAATNGIILDSFPDNVSAGVRIIFTITSLTSFAALLIVVFVMRKIHTAKSSDQP